VESSTQPLVITFLGSIGVGKSFFARQLGERTQTIRLNADGLRISMYGTRAEYNRINGTGPEANRPIFGAYDYMIKEILAAKKNVILDVTQFNVLKRRQELANIALASGAAVILVWIETPREIARDRVLTRDIAYDQTRVTDARAQELFDQHDAHFGAPRPDELVIKIDGTVPFDEQYNIFNQQLAILLGVKQHV
jgi:predicted kinase